jgi:hypothetical protein
MYVTEIAAIAAALISLYSVWSNKTDKRFDELKADMKEGFAKVDRRFERMEDQMEGVKADISEVKERIAGLEMSTIFVQFNPNPVSRSEVAKKMWEKRKAKKVLESKGTNV